MPCLRHWLGGILRGKARRGRAVDGLAGVGVNRYGIAAGVGLFDGVDASSSTRYSRQRDRDCAGCGVYFDAAVIGCGGVVGGLCGDAGSEVAGADQVAELEVAVGACGAVVDLCYAGCIASNAGVISKPSPAAAPPYNYR